MSGAEDLRREVLQCSKQLQSTFERVEKLQVDFATVTATRDAFEFRHREGLEELRKALEHGQGAFQDDLQAQLKRWSSELRAEIRAALKSEENAIAALDEQLWLTDQ